MARELARRVGRSGGLFDLRSEVDRLFEDFFGGDATLERSDVFVPKLDVRDNEDAYLLRVELPGIDPNDVSIDLDDDVLTVRGERQRDSSETRGGYEYSESSYGSFVRSLQLPRGIDASHVDASMNQGVLEITVPKVATAQQRKIPVKAVSASASQPAPSMQEKAPDKTQSPAGGGTSVKVGGAEARNPKS